MELTDNILYTLDSKVNNYRRYKWKHYEKSGITFTKDVIAKDCTESITIYNKHKEICSSKNDKFLSCTKAPEFIKQSFDGITRFEVIYDSMEKIRNGFNISDTHIDKVFSATTNPILEQFDKVFGSAKNIKLQKPTENYDEFAMMNIIKSYNYDLKLIEQEMRRIYSSRSGVNDRMKKIKAVYDCMLESTETNSTQLNNIRTLLL